MSCERLCVGCEKDIRCSRFLGLRKASGFDLWNELMDWISQNPNARMVVPKPALYNTIHPFQGSMRRSSLSKTFFWWLASLNIPYFGGWHPIWHEGKQVFNPLGIWRHPVWHEGQIPSLYSLDFFVSNQNSSFAPNYCDSQWNVLIRYWTVHSI